MYNMKIKKWLRIILPAAVLCLTMALTTSAQDAQSDLLSRINNLRASVGQSSYRLNGALNAAAANHAAWMVETGQISHTQWDGSTPRTRAASAGYPSSWVSENIYMGTNASVGSAWTFWINSPIHYKGLTSPNYDEVGIAESVGANGRAYVLVFGASSGANIAAAARAVANDASSASEAPSFVVGLDDVGNIMHEVQPGDTLGDIALIYGYTWDDLPHMLEINDLTWDNYREILPGSVLLVPPKAGTYTPTPEPEITATPTANADEVAAISQEPAFTATPTTEDAAGAAGDTAPVELQPTEPLPTTITQQPDTQPIISPSPTQSAPTATLTVTPSPTTRIIVRALPAATRVASADTPPAASAAIVDDAAPASGPPPWLVGAILVQLMVLGVATFEFFRRR